MKMKKGIPAFTNSKKPIVQFRHTDKGGTMDIANLYCYPNGKIVWGDSTWPRAIYATSGNRKKLHAHLDKILDYGLDKCKNDLEAASLCAGLRGRHHP